MKFYADQTRAMENARFILEEIAEAKEGNQILILADSESYANVRVLADCARKLNMKVLIADMDVYGGAEGYDHMPVMEPLRQAILMSDITFMTTPQIKTGYSMYLGNKRDGDASLAAGTRRYTLEIGGLEEWELDREQIFNNFRRTRLLYGWLRQAKELHITTARGADLKCDLSAPDGMYPVLGIIPFYAEVAIVPAIGSVSGTAVIDGASERAYSQRGFPIRPNLPTHSELYMDPMKLVFEKSRLIAYDGPAVQKARLDRLMQTVTPPPVFDDEIGIVTTDSIENNQYGWKVDGSHQIHCVHVALGNNTDRKKTIHAKEHIDFDMHDPSIWVDGIRICSDGIFDDGIIRQHAPAEQGTV